MDEIAIDVLSKHPYEFNCVDRLETNGNDELGEKNCILAGVPAKSLKQE